MLQGKGHVKDGVGLFETSDGRTYEYRYGKLRLADGERIALMGGEPYEVWAGRDGTAQRLYKAYRARWPHSRTICAAVGSELYVRYQDGGMRQVAGESDFDHEREWCAQCGTPVDPDDGYACESVDCRRVLCEDCYDCLECDGCHCPAHRHVAVSGLL